MSHALLRVQLLGSLNLVYNDAPITGVNSARLQSLFAYLILHADTPQSRQHLAFLLWPNTTEAQARNNLRQFLYQLRQVLPDTARFLSVDTNTVYWKTDEGQVIDVFCFERCLSAADAAERHGDIDGCVHWLEQAIGYYQEDLLPTCYDDWVAAVRDRLRRQVGNACQKLVPLLETRRRYADAIPVAQRLHRLDPLDESVYVALVRLHGFNEDAAGARRVFQLASDTLLRELGEEPGEALREAYRHLQRAPRLGSFSDDDVKVSSYRLVGRQAEWQQLQEAWQRAMAGGARLGLLSGEAGIGKSRLAEEFFHWVMRQGFTAAHTRTYGVEGNLALAPVAEWLRSPALRPHLASLDPVWLTEIARLLPEIVTDHPGLARPDPITEYGLRQRFFEALARGVLAAPRPLLLWIDDLQWCDQETLEWLHFLLRFDPRCPMLMLGTARSEETPPDHPLTALTRQLQVADRVDIVELSAFDAAETAKLASQVQGYALDDSASVRLYHETEGNPLFVVETVRAGLTPAIPSQSATTTPDAPRLPPRVQAIIAGRLAQLSPTARTVVEIGAVIGRAFHLDLLLLAGRENEDTVIEALDELWLRRIVREQRANVFDFTHDKLREVAYSETSLPQRRLLHRRIAQALEALNADMLDPISAQVAAHFEQAGLFDRAFPYYQRAGLVASGVYANEDAIHLYSRGLEMLEKLPVSPQRDALELNIQLALATLYRVSKGWASPAEERVMNRAMVLSDRVGDVEQRLRTLFALQALSVVQAKYDHVERYYAQAAQLFRQTQGTPPFAEIYLAGAKLFTGQIVEARELFERIVAVRNSEHILNLQESHGLNYLAHGLAWNAHALWCLGYPRLAVESAHAAIGYAREFAQPFSQALAITYMAMLQTWLTDTETFLVYAEEACALAVEYKAPYYHAWANILRCFAVAERQADGDSFRQIENAVHVFTETGARARLPVYFSMVAQVCLTSGRWEEGLLALEKAWTEAVRNNEHWWDAEILRLRGELIWAQGADLADIEAVFRNAIEIAQSQQARSLELRAATSLARLLKGASRPAEAKQCLTQVYAWFTEGFDTPDLKSAQALIAQL